MKNFTVKVWNSITGRAVYEEANKQLDKIEKDYAEALAKYNNDLSSISNLIESKISKINLHKTDIYGAHFKRFVELGSMVHNISVKGSNFLDYFDDSVIKLNKTSNVRGKNEIFEIDFDNLKFKEKFLGVITLGFYTRKKAKKTLENVKEEKVRIEEEIQRMESQTVKARVILESIDNVTLYFDDLIKNYQKILDRFEYGIKIQTQIEMLNGNLLIGQKLDFKMLPIIHIEDFQALFNLSIVLKQMASFGYLGNDGEIVEAEIRSLEFLKSMVDNAELIAA